MTDKENHHNVALLPEGGKYPLSLLCFIFLCSLCFFIIILTLPKGGDVVSLETIVSVCMHRMGGPVYPPRINRQFPLRSR